MRRAFSSKEDAKNWFDRKRVIRLPVDYPVQILRHHQAAIVDGRAVHYPFVLLAAHLTGTTRPSEVVMVLPNTRSHRTMPSV
jgi:hypothetical protein